MIAIPNPIQIRFWRYRVFGRIFLWLGCALCGLGLLPSDGAESGVGTGGRPAAVSRPPIEESLRLETRAALRRGCRRLKSWQLPDGSWAEHPAVTSLAVLALLNAGPLAATDPQRLDAALNFICQKIARAGMRKSHPEPPYPVFTTAVSMLALIRADRLPDQAILRSAREFLLSSQVTGTPDTEPHAGGFRREPKTRPDLTTTEYVLEALYLSDCLDRPPLAAEANTGRRADAAYAQAAAFIGRCQIPMTDAGMGGGFQDTPPAAPEPPAAGPTHSPGYLLCAGLKSLLYANVPVNDPRVQAAVTRLKRIYTVEKNPGAGAAGYYTYLYTLTKALAAWEAQATAAPAVSPPAAWRRQVTEALLVRQQGDGSWRQPIPGGWENRAELSTAYALLTLELTLDEVPLAPPAANPLKP